MYECLNSTSTIGDLNTNTAFLLAELHLQNELLYALLQKDKETVAIPNQENISRLIRFFKAVLDEPAHRDDTELPLKHFSFPDKKQNEEVTLFMNLIARDIEKSNY